MLEGRRRHGLARRTTPSALTTYLQIMGSKPHTAHTTFAVTARSQPKPPASPSSQGRICWRKSEERFTAQSESAEPVEAQGTSQLATLPRKPGALACALATRSVKCGSSLAMASLARRDSSSLRCRPDG